LWLKIIGGDMSIRAFVVVGLWVFGIVSPAFAYIDPGTGILMWQGLLALIAGVIVFFKNPMAALRALFKRIRGKQE
jgi:uncharacterized membrane protein HdeD (DUF308 family)